MSQAKIHCSFTRVEKLENIKPNPRNPNQHPASQIELLARLIEGHGWRIPITVSKRSGFVVRGHGRLAAAQLLGLAEAPIDEQDYASDDMEMADLLADNKIAELADPDYQKIGEILGSLPAEALNLTGFADFEIAALSKILPPQAIDVTPEPLLPGMECVCPKCQAVHEVRNAG